MGHGGISRGLHQLVVPDIVLCFECQEQFFRRLKWPFFQVLHSNVVFISDGAHLST